MCILVKGFWETDGSHLDDDVPYKLLQELDDLTSDVVESILEKNPYALVQYSCSPDPNYPSLVFQCFAMHVSNFCGYRSQQYLFLIPNHSFHDFIGNSVCLNFHDLDEKE
ncbi:hypothetical protein NPIL_687761 [Nephila pilipes]|uniref:Uncharacterized protein n=1 Tax=Nephila pilipes TaxID=299642 RepID=A0A8X6TIV3_NEPPI|nr:hypothetical protein NPIL_687761 [Nephila pilipes]